MNCDSHSFFVGVQAPAPHPTPPLLQEFAAMANKRSHVAYATMHKPKQAGRTAWCPKKSHIRHKRLFTGVGPQDHAMLHILIGMVNEKICEWKLTSCSCPYVDAHFIVPSLRRPGRCMHASCMSVSSSCCNRSFNLLNQAACDEDAQNYAGHLHTCH